MTEGPFASSAEFAMSSRPLAKSARSARADGFALEKREGSSFERCLLPFRPPVPGQAVVDQLAGHPGQRFHPLRLHREGAQTVEPA